MSGITRTDEVAHARGVFAVDADKLAVSIRTAGVASGNKPARAQADTKAKMKN